MSWCAAPFHMEPGDTSWIVVHDLNKKCFIIGWNEDLTSDKVKEVLRRGISSVQYCCQRLLFNRKMLTDNVRLSDVGVKPKDILHYYADSVCPHRPINH